MKSREIFDLMNSGNFNLENVCESLLLDANDLINIRRCGTFEAKKSCYLEQLTKFENAHKKFVSGGGIGIGRYALLIMFNSRLDGMFMYLIKEQSDLHVKTDIQKVFLEVSRQVDFADDVTKTWITINALIKLKFEMLTDMIEANPNESSDIALVFVDEMVKHIVSFDCENWAKFEENEVRNIVTKQTLELLGK